VVVAATSPADPIQPEHIEARETFDDAIAGEVEGW
jgi:hypothetical protein